MSYDGGLTSHACLTRNGVWDLPVQSMQLGSAELLLQFATAIIIALLSSSPVFEFFICSVLFTGLLMA